MTLKPNPFRPALSSVAFVVAAALAFPASSASAAAPGASLNKCQAAVAKESGKYIRSLSRTVGKCLKAISSDVLADGATADEAAWASSKGCAQALRKVVNSEDASRQMATRFLARVDQFCDPSVNPDLAHADADIWSPGSSTLGAANLGAYCQATGGDGNIGSYAEWRACMAEAAQCQARQLVATQWPRALESFDALRPALARMPAGAERDDALAALDAINSAIEGKRNDNLPELACGLWGSSLLVTGQTRCDQGDGTLGDCAAAADGNDAKHRAGRGFRYVDNGDGTISDLVTGLMWEKLSDDGSWNDMDWCYELSTLDLKPEFRLNRSGFAGYRDWRVPTRAELETLVDAGRDRPAMDPIFDHDCTPGCTVTTCSCTNAGTFLTSTPDAADGNYILNWLVDFGDGSVKSFDGLHYMRAVRGGKTNHRPAPSQPPVALDRSVRNPWRSPCVPVQLLIEDSDSRSIEYSIISLPEHGFLTEFIAGECNNDYPPLSEADLVSELFGLTTIETGGVKDRFYKTMCYIPFSSTFTGFDTFEYGGRDNEGNWSAPGIFSIEIFED